MNSRPPIESHRRDLKKVLRAIQDTPSIDREYMAPREEFQQRVHRTNQALQQHGHTVGLVFSDEHYAGDVPYLGGNTNIAIEQVAGVIGPNGFHIVAGLEGGYVAEQLAAAPAQSSTRSSCSNWPTKNTPVGAERLDDIIEAAAGKGLGQIALLTPRQVIPASLCRVPAEHLRPRKRRRCAATLLPHQVREERIEMRLIRDACIVADAMMRAMLAVLRPGMLETEVAAWGAWLGRMLGCEDNGFQIMVGADAANRTLIGKALNRPIAARRLGAPGRRPEARRSQLLPPPLRHRRRLPSKVTPEQKYWFDLVEEEIQSR